MCNKLGLKKLSKVWLDPLQQKLSYDERSKLINYCKANKDPCYDYRCFEEIIPKYNRNIYNYLDSINGKINPKNRRKMKFGKKLLDYCHLSKPTTILGYWEGYKYYPETIKNIYI